MSRETNKVQAALGYLEACAGLHANATDDPIMRAQIHAQTDRVRDALAAAQAEAQQQRGRADSLQAELARVRVLCPEVIAFAQLMQRKLDLNKHKPSWKGDSAYTLLERLFEEAVELHEALENSTDEAVGLEAADVANFAMMIADVCGILSHPAEPPEPKTDLPLMARREWMPDAANYVAWDSDGNPLFFGELPEQLLFTGAWSGLVVPAYGKVDRLRSKHHVNQVMRIAATDEHGLPVIERTADMPERAKYRYSDIYTNEISYGTNALGVTARSVSVERIGDYNAHTEPAQREGQISE